MIVPLLLSEILGGLGFGQRVIVVTIFLMLIWYLFRARRVAGRSASMAATLWLVMIAIAGAAAVAIFLGWIDPEPGQAVGDVLAWVEAAGRFIWGPIDDIIRTLWPFALWPP